MPCAARNKQTLPDYVNPLGAARHRQSDSQLDGTAEAALLSPKKEHVSSADQPKTLYQQQGMVG